MMHDIGDSGWGMGWGMGFGGIFMILFWVLVIGVIFVLVKWLTSSRGSDAGNNASDERTALNILQERYARGEIDRDEFEQKRQDLER